LLLVASLGPLLLNSFYQAQPGKPASTSVSRQQSERAIPLNLCTPRVLVFHRIHDFSVTQLTRISGIILNSNDFYPIRVNGTYNASSRFRGPPTPEVDTAWERYWKVWMVGVDEETFRASDPQHPESSVRLEKTGEYLATFEATHQLHCLYNLFRASYVDAYPAEKADYEQDPDNWHRRVDHCVEILRQKLEW
jgi:hypothetical protein